MSINYHPKTESPIVDHSIGSADPYEEWTPDAMIIELRERDDRIMRLMGAEESWTLRVLSQTERTKELVEKLEKIKSRTFDDWLKGWVDDRVQEKLKDGLDDMDLDVDSISGLDDEISNKVESAVEEQVSEVRAEDITGIENLIDERSEELVDEKLSFFEERIKEVAGEMILNIEIESRIK